MCWGQTLVLAASKQSASMENTKWSYEEPSQDLRSCNIWKRDGGMIPAVYKCFQFQSFFIFPEETQIFRKEEYILVEKNYELYMKLIAPEKKIDNLLDAIGLALSY